MSKFGARKFNQESYDKNDDYAKQKFINYITKKGHKIVSEEENYKHDIVTKKGDKLFYFELEIKHNYPFTTNESFRFDSVSFLGRKERLHKIQEFHYVIICKETDWAVSCKSNEIFQKKHEQFLTINTTHRQGKDKMYRVPKDKCRFFDMA